METGEYLDEFESGDDSGDWEDYGDPECDNCGSTDLEDLSCLTTEQFKIIMGLDDDDRLEAFKIMEKGGQVDPESGQELTVVPRAKGTIIGKRKVQP
jgi:hypothetical protein